VLFTWTVARLVRGPCEPLAWTTWQPKEDEETRLSSAFLVGPDRSFKQDPRFGMIVLSEIASRALSPGVNDPGTAIDVSDGSFDSSLTAPGSLTPGRKRSNSRTSMFLPLPSATCSMTCSLPSLGTEPAMWRWDQIAEGAAEFGPAPSAALPRACPSALLPCAQAGERGPHAARGQRRDRTDGCRGGT
jgi:hypothetical protein